MAKRKPRPVLTLNSLEANFLLYCLDDYCKTDSRGRVQFPHSHESGPDVDAQDLRDRLFVNAVEPTWEDE